MSYGPVAQNLWDAAIEWYVYIQQKVKEDEISDNRK